MLPLNVHIAERPSYLYARLEGFQSRSHSPAVIEAIAAASLTSGLRRVLLDFRDVAGALAPADHAEAGRTFAAALPNCKCAALLDRWQYTGVGLGAAQAGGMEIEVFFDERDAVTWLLANGSVPMQTAG